MSRHVTIQIGNNEKWKDNVTEQKTKACSQKDM